MNIDALQTFTDQVPEWLQVLLTMLWGMIPYIESEVAAVIAVLAGLPLPVAIGAAIAGNVISVLVVILLSDKLRRVFKLDKKPDEDNIRVQKIQKLLNRYGVPGVSILGPFVAAGHGSALILIALGADKKAVIFWQIVAISIGGIAAGVLAWQGVNLLT